jgi:predicted Zn-ribbon and HTH transcriptional regulator
VSGREKTNKLEQLAEAMLRDIDHLLGPAERQRLRNAMRAPQPVGCDLCGWRGRRKVARSAPCPNCGSGKVQYR